MAFGPSVTSSSTTASNIDETGQTIINPDIIQQLKKGFGGLTDYGINLMSNPVMAQFSAPQSIAGGSNPMDVAIVQQALAKAKSNLATQQAAQNRNMAGALANAGGNNSALLAALNRQAGMATAGAANELMPLGLQQQREADMQRSRLVAEQNAQQLGYEQAKAQSALASRGQQLQGLGLGGGLLGTLLDFGKLTGIQIGNRQGSEQTQAKQKKNYLG